MTRSFVSLAFILVLAGTAVAQQQPRRATNSKASTGTTSTVSPNDVTRSNPSAANTHDGTNGASTGTGLTNDQLQAASAPPNTSGTTKVDARSSVRTGASTVKARKKSPKPNN
ncbi:hypothetical protein [Spirosoma sp. KNUC1025]|uniref:hypothetical protein n=1 Tax=Spirosoma sp. KNUC1025 TaxID=2894082 RepID=UPI00386A5A05|nr:hypothetical protein LN737_12970 [Spirosoma sp. KNUC1025]